MYNTDLPNRAELSSSRQLSRSTLIVIIVAAILLVAIVLPADVKIDTHAFRQADFIERAIWNVNRSLIEGAILVVVLFLFLQNFRTTFISLTAIPLSLLTAILAMNYFGITINTMTLGGLAIASGELTDDAIVDAENVFRRLKQNAQKQMPEPVLTVVYFKRDSLVNRYFDYRFSVFTALFFRRL